MFCTMISCERERPYQRVAIGSYLADPAAPLLHIFVTGENGHYLGDFIIADRVSVIPKPPGHSSLAIRCVLNGARAFAAAKESGEALLYMEDDIELGERWVSRLAACVDETQASCGSDFVLALFAMYAPRAPNHKRVAPYHPSDFYGLQACYFSRSVVPIVADAAAANVNSNKVLPTDLLVKSVMSNNKIPLRQTRPHLAQHWGDMSSVDQRMRVMRSAHYRGEEP